MKGKEKIKPARSGRWWRAAVLAAALGWAIGPAAGAQVEDIQSLIAGGDLAAALKQVDARLAVDGEDVTYLFLKGLILTRQERLQEARDIFLAITRSHPELPEPYNNLAVVYAALGKYDEARQALEQAINTHPAYATAHENIGDIYAKLASQAYNQALELDNDNNTARAKLSLVNELFSLPAAEPAAALAPAPATAAEPPAPAPVAVAEPPAPAPVPAPDNKEAVAAVKQAVRDWAAVWSDQDVEAYLSAYADEFTPPPGLSLEQWRNQRRDRVGSPGSIKVTISDLAVEMLGDQHAQAIFTQVYESDSYRDRVRKSLLLKRENGRWLIIQEDTR